MQLHIINNNNILTFAILKYKSPFSSSLTIKIRNWHYWPLPSLLFTWPKFLVVQVEVSFFPNLATSLRWRWRCQWGFIFAFEGNCISFKRNIEPGLRRGISIPYEHFADNAYLAESITRGFPLKTNSHINKKSEWLMILTTW